MKNFIYRRKRRFGSLMTFIRNQFLMIPQTTKAIRLAGICALMLTGYGAFSDSGLADTDPPYIISTSPADDAIRVDTDGGTLSFTFNEPVVVNPSLLTSQKNQLILRNSNGSTLQQFDVYTSDITISGSTVTMNNVQTLTYGSSYYVTMLANPKLFQDVAGNPMVYFDGSADWRFTVRTSDLDVVTLMPANGATAVEPSTELSITFDEDVFSPTGGLTWNIQLRKLSDGSYVSQFPTNNSLYVDYDGPKLTLLNVPTLELGEGYYLTIPSTALEDDNNRDFEGFANESFWSFTVKSEVDPPVISTLFPADDFNRVAPDEAGFYMIFNETVTKVNGETLALYEKGSKGNDVLKATASTTSNITYNKGKYLIDFGLTNPFDRSKSYYILVPEGSFVDANENVFAGLTAVTDWNFSINAIPTAINLPDAAVDENEEIGTVVSTFSTADANAGDSFTYTLVSGHGNQDNASFSISGNELLTAVSFDYESVSNPLSIRVRSTDEAGEYIEESFEITINDVLDTGPALVSSTPDETSSNVLPTSVLIEMTFDQEVFNQGTAAVVFEIFDPSDTRIYAYFGSNNISTVNFEGNTATIQVGNIFESNTTYTVVFNNNFVENSLGMQAPGDSWTFTTRANDGNGPDLVSINPVNGATELPRTGQLFEMVFDEPVNVGSLASTYSFYRAADDVKIGGATFSSYNEDHTSIRFYYQYTLAFNTAYYILGDELNSGGYPVVYDEDGNSFAGFSDKSDWTFQTYGPVAIESQSPADDAVGVATNTSISITGNHEILANSNGNISLRDYNTGNFLSTITAQSASVVYSGNTVTMDFGIPLEGNKHYFLTFGSVFVDQFGQYYPSTGSSYDLWDFYTIDDVGPMVANFTPADDVTGVVIDADLVITFDEEIQPITDAFIQIRFDGGTVKETIYLDGGNVSFSGNTLTINPDADLNYETGFYVYFPPGSVEDVFGNDFEGFTDDQTWSFTTESEPDVTPPTVLNFNPAHNATDVEVNPTQLQISFNENIQLGTEGMVNIKRVSDDATFLSSLSNTPGLLLVSNNLLVINLSGSFDYETEYYVSLAAGVVEDISGNDYSGLDNNTTWRFTTQVEPFGMVSLSPANGATEVDIAADLTLSFNKNGTISAGNIKIYRSDNDNLVASLSNFNSNYMLISGHDITFNFPADLEEGVQYYIEVSDGYLRSAANASDAWAGIQDKTSWAFTTKQIITWDGASWSNGSGPTSETDAIINGDYSFSSHGAFTAKNLTVNSGSAVVVGGENFLALDGDLTNNGNITIESGSSLLTNGGNSITGNDITFKRFTRYADGKYSFVGSPVAQSASITGAHLGSSVYKYQENVPFGVDGINRWESASGNQLTPGRGYTQAFQKEIVFVGKPNTGTVTYTGTYTEDVDNAYEGWNLVSNPYPAAISVASFLAGNFNVGGAVYFWDDNGSDTGRGSNSDYIVANGSVATNTTPAGGQVRYNQALGSAQGFFVKLSSSFNKDIVFLENMRVTGQNSDDNFFRKADEELSYIRINLTNQEGLFKQTILGWLTDISNIEVDRKFDAAVFNEKSDYSIYTFKSNTPLAIQGITSRKEEVPLGLNVAEQGSYSIEIDLENHRGQAVFLKDNLTGETVDLTSGAYSFSSTVGQITDRFVLTTASGILALDDQKANIYAIDKVLHIEMAGFHPAEYLVYSLSGKRIMEVLISGTTKIDLNHVPNGVYLISDGIETKKIILK